MVVLIAVLRSCDLSVGGKALTVGKICRKGGKGNSKRGRQENPKRNTAVPLIHPCERVRDVRKKWPDTLS